jgi:hypothetical protein
MTNFVNLKLIVNYGETKGDSKEEESRTFSLSLMSDVKHDNSGKGRT